MMYRFWLNIALFALRRSGWPCIAIVTNPEQPDNDDAEVVVMALAQSPYWVDRVVKTREEIGRIL